MQRTWISSQHPENFILIKQSYPELTRKANWPPFAHVPEELIALLGPSRIDVASFSEIALFSMLDVLTSQYEIKIWTSRVNGCG